MLSLLAAVTMVQGGVGPNETFNPKLLEGMGLRRTRSQSPVVKRQWVVTKTPDFKALGALKSLPKFFFLDSELVSNIDKASIPIEDQGHRGTCTIFATKFLVEYELARQTKFSSSVRLNPEYLNWTANATTNSADDGASFPAVVTGLDEYGCSNWDDPKVYGIQKADFDPNYKPSKPIVNKATPLKKSVALFQIFTHPNPEMTDQDMDLVVRLLNAKTPVAVGQQWPAEGAWKTTMVDGMKVLDGTGPTDGAHTMAIVGYKKTPKAPGGGYFLFRNSWNTTWGYDGYHFMSFDWVRHHVYDGCIAVPTAWVQ